MPEALPKPKMIQREAAKVAQPLQLHAAARRGFLLRQLSASALAGAHGRPRNGLRRGETLGLSRACELVNQCFYASKESCKPLDFSVLGATCLRRPRDLPERPGTCGAQRTGGRSLVT